MKVPLTGALALFALLADACAAPAPLERHEYEDAAMGTRFRIVLYADSPARAERAARAAFGRVHALDALLSDYRDDSEAARLSAASGGPAQPVAEDTWRVLALAQSYAELSDGAFDVTAGPVVALWRRARRQGELPDPARLALALESTGWRHVELDGAARSVRLDRKGMQLDFGGIAKGYALDCALDELERHGLARALVDGGGDVAVREPPPGRTGWSVTIRPFSDESAALTLELARASVATSGDAFQSLELEGVRYSHIVDPRTGAALSNRTSTSVVAPDGASADALATALCVLGPGPGLALAGRLGVQARIARELPAGVECAATPGFAALILSDLPPASPPAASKETVR